MNKLTNNAVDTASLKFVALLEEGLAYVNLWTPTEVNQGGCGVFADLLTNEFDKCGISYKIIGLFDKDYSKRVVNLKNYIQNNSGDLKKAIPCHIVVLVSNILYIDITGIVNAQALLSFARKEISKEILKEMISIEKGAWNETFDRATIPIIQQKLDDVFDHLNDFHSGIFTYPDPVKDREKIQYTEVTKEGLQKTEFMQMFGGFQF